MTYEELCQNAVRGYIFKQNLTITLMDVDNGIYIF